MAGDRHAGVKRCLHPLERREFISTGDFSMPRERCLDCRAMRQRRIVFKPQTVDVARHSQVRWGPWVSAGEQVKQALVARGQAGVSLTGILILDDPITEQGSPFLVDPSKNVAK